MSNITEALGLQSKGSLVTDQYAVYEGRQMGKVPFVLITGWAKPKREEFAREEGESTRVAPLITKRFSEFSLIPLHVWHYMTYSNDLDETGFVVFTYKDGEYGCYFPEAGIGAKATKKRFAYKPEDQMLYGAVFSVPVCKRDDILQQTTLPPEKQNKMLRIVAEFAPEFRFLAIGKFIELGGYLLLGEKPGYGNNYLFLFDQGGIERLVKKGRADQSIEGLVTLSLPGDLTKILTGEAYYRKRGEIERNWGRHIPLGVLPSELAKERTGSWTQEERALRISGQDRKRMIERLRQKVKREYAAAQAEDQ